MTGYTAPINQHAIFISDIISAVEFISPITILPEFVFRQATQDEIEQLRPKINSVIKVALGDIFPNPYENKIVVNSQQGSQTSYSWMPLNAEDFRYWVISTAGWGAFTKTQLFKHALRLSSIELNCDFEVGLTYQQSDNDKKLAMHSSGGKLLQFVVYLHDMQFRGYPNTGKIVRQSDIDEIREIYTLLSSFTRGNFKHIENAYQDYGDLNLVPDWSFLKIVGLCSIIESLITHNSRSSENSITRQLQKKMLLLNKRFRHPLNFATEFPGPNTLTAEKIIEKIYQFRSQIAHGTPSDFVNDLQILQSREHVQDFLNRFVKQLILFSLKEPELLSDLKEC